MEDLRIYYSPFGYIRNNCFFIEDRATRLDKDRESVLISLKTGAPKCVEIKDLGSFISKNAENLQYEQREMLVEGVDLF